MVEGITTAARLERVSPLTMHLITRLDPHQVFVFGSNRQGFHGAGAAGLACRGTALNTWRQDPWFRTAMNAPVGSRARIGKWAVFGIGKGFQVGREGRSYAICTIERPGDFRSIPVTLIEAQLLELCAFARAHPELEFLMTPVGAGKAGYSPAVMGACFASAMGKAGGIPTNLVAPADLYR